MWEDGAAKCLKYKTNGASLVVSSVVYFEYTLDLKGCSRGGSESGSKVFWTLKYVSV